MASVPTTPLATVVLSRLTASYTQAADPARAPAMRAYMRDQFDFLGISSPRQSSLARDVLRGTAPPGEADLRAVGLACWRHPEREYQYFACAYLRRHAAVCTAAFLPTVETLIITKSWWDTVDALASHVVGTMVRTDPVLLSTMDLWITADNLWLVRTALLHQLRHREATDADRLFGYCTTQAGHPDFFVRKAIGWALRQYAYVAPDAVRAFVDDHGELSGLSRREALKNL